MKRIGQNIYKSLSILLLSILMTQATCAFSQTKTLTGIVKDKNTGEPVNNVNIIINETQNGTVTGNDGRFSLKTADFPITITISCIGYETLIIDILKLSAQPLEFLLRPVAYTLGEVNIEAVKIDYLFKDQNYSILDYEILDDRLWLLIYRYPLKFSEIVILTLYGDTLSIARVPESKPKKLFRDFLGNIHYFSGHGNAFQCYYDEEDEKIWFPYEVPVDSLVNTLKPFLFIAGGHYYFEEFSPDGFNKKFGYYDERHHKKIIHYMNDKLTRRRYYDDMHFYNRYNYLLDDTSSYNPLRIDEHEMRAHILFNYGKVNATLMKLGENDFALFNFIDDSIQLMDREGKIYQSAPVSFQNENEELLVSVLNTFVSVSGWKWTGQIFIDEYFREAYTTYKKDSKIRIRKIDLKTGQLSGKYDIALPFPEKLKIYKGDAYFLNKEAGSDSDKWKLVKQKL